ncbi:MAG TPA: S9 family peptidase [Bacteroidales bacterium]|nr:S9 family peptidase [Bacteroidales bacterium]
MKRKYYPAISARRYVFVLTCLFLLFFSWSASSQPGIRWSEDGNSYYKVVNNEILKFSLPGNQPITLISKDLITPAGASGPLRINYFSVKEAQGKALIFTNTKRVWRLNTKGDYWVVDLNARTIKQLGKTLPPSSLMFAKISPDGQHAAYVSGNNIYVEDLATSEVKPLTNNGSVTLINGTFDWAYEEEFFCRDGFRWSPDSKTIAYWQIDAGNIRKFYMINNTDSVYSRIIPIEYPKVGQNPSSAKIGVVNISDGKTIWMDIPGDPYQHYIIRMEYIPATGKLLTQQLNRKQNESKLYVSDIMTGKSDIIFQESDEAWVDQNEGPNPYDITYVNEFLWLNNSRSVLWISEKDGWRHLYDVSLEGKPEKLLTAGNYDVISFKHLDSKGGYLYYMASPDNPTQEYLYRTNVKRPDKPELVSPASLKGTHNYSISPNGKYASHSFSNYYTRPSSEILSMPTHKPLNEKESILRKQDSLRVKTTTEYFKVTIEGGIELDGWMSKPQNFDPSKKYPVFFYVYTEPASSTVKDTYGVDKSFLYAGDITKDGYIGVSLDNRGTPMPKGRAWRKAIYRKIGRINISDQALGAAEVLKWSFVDPERVAVCGWSGGGSATLNLMFQHPEIYKTGVAVAAVTNLLTYDNIYQERYMGLPQENKEDFVNGSPLTYAKNLKGNLLYIHGTGDDNVHYQNAEMLINELVKYNKQFQFMAYPNRTHGISEGPGTSMHLIMLCTDFIKKFCPPGPK